MNEAEIDHEWDASSHQGKDEDPKSSSNPIVWSVNVEGKEVVDMTHAELVERVRKGSLPVTTNLWRDGMEDWKALDRFPEFEGLVVESRGHDSGMRAKPEEYEPTDAVGPDATPTHISSKAAPAPAAAPPPPVTAPNAPAAGASESASETSERDETSDAVKGFGFLAVYERPVATLEFSTVRDESEGEDDVASDALTPSRHLEPKGDALTPSRHLEPKHVPPRPGARKNVPPPPPLPALQRAVHKPKAATKPEPSRPRAERTTLPGPIAIGPAFSANQSDDLEAEPLAAEEVMTAARPAPVEASPTPNETPVPPPASVVGPPRPAIASLPPIIVRELPISTTDLVATPLPAPLDESTLVLGRRRTHRWVPLRAAILSAFGSACLASVLTWAIVRPGRALRAAPPPARDIAQAPQAAALPEPKATPEAPAPEPAAALTQPEVEATATPAESPAKPAASEPAAKSRKSSDATRASSASLGTSTSSDAKSDEPWRREDPDPGLVDATKPAAANTRTNAPAGTRAGWPSNPGF